MPGTARRANALLCRLPWKTVFWRELPLYDVKQLSAGDQGCAWPGACLPHINDLRDFGALEDNADLFILLHREHAYAKDSPRAGEADLIVAKHRYGPTATLTVAHQGRYGHFVGSPWRNLLASAASGQVRSDPPSG
ncbi:DnaB-like helicase C-terminal domain-containing protein (plasmid) [Streptomyces sp. CA-100214]